MKMLIVGVVAALAGIINAAAVSPIIDVTVLPEHTDSERPWPPRPTKTVTETVTPSSASTTTTFEISITTLPVKPTTPLPVVCPTVTHTTRPSNCEPMLCPVPGCTFQRELLVPCGCAGVKTALFVDGCQTACPEGCITRLRTVTAACATQTPAL